MFMRNNRALNGAEQPEQVERDDAAAQREQEMLVTNPPLGAPQKRTFEPDLSTLDEINRRHKMGGLDEGEWPGDYEEFIPVGPKMGR